jgi:hypothetical protein
MSKKNLVSTALIMLLFISLFNIAVWAAPIHRLTIMTRNGHGKYPGDYHEDNCRRLAPLWRMETEHIQVNCLPYQLREKQSISDHYSAIADLFF